MDKNEEYAKEIGLDHVPIKHHPVHRFSNVFVNVVLLIAGLASIAFLYLVFFPHRVIDIKSAVVTTPVIKAGDDIIVKFNYCAYISQEGIVYRVLKSGDNAINLPSTTTITEPGCREATLLIPTNRETPAGTYTLHDYAIYQINPLRSERAAFDTKPFTIVK